MQEKVKQLRLGIDGIAQLTKDLKPIKGVSDGMVHLPNVNSKEIDKAYDSLIFAKAWLGKVMGELGVASPYKSGYKTKEDIEPTADVADKALPNFLTLKGDFSELSHIEKVDYLRTAIDDLVKEVKELGTPIAGETTFTTTREFAIARTNSYNHLCEARFWLGFELQRIKESN